METCLKNRLDLLLDVLPNNGLFVFTKNSRDDARADSQRRVHTDSSLKITCGFIIGVLNFRVMF